jgi:hypothetical protein
MHLYAKRTLCLAHGSVYQTPIGGPHQSVRGRHRISQTWRNTDLLRISGQNRDAGRVQDIPRTAGFEARISVARKGAWNAAIRNRSRNRQAPDCIASARGEQLLSRLPSQA